MTVSPPVASRSPSGRRVVAAIVLLGLCLAGFAFWFQWRQTRRCLAFLGADVARAISRADRVELWRLGAGDRPRRLKAVGRQDVSRAPGLVHLRHALVEDASYVWTPAPRDGTGGPQPLPDWEMAIAFFPRRPTDAPEAVLVFDARFGAMTVVGRPGRVALGRLGSGLERWVRLVSRVATAGPAGARTAP